MNDHRSRLLKDPAYALEAAKGDLIMDVTENVCKILERESVSRQALAEKMNKTKGHISQILNGNRNMTLATLAEIAHVLGYAPVFRLEKKRGPRKHLGTFEIDLNQDQCEYQTEVA